MPSMAKLSLLFSTEKNFRGENIQFSIWSSFPVQDLLMARRFHFRSAESSIAHMWDGIAVR